MGKLKRFWQWLSNPANQTTVALVGGGVAAIVGGAWALYVHFSKPTIPDVRPPMPIRGTFASEFIIIPITPERFKSLEPLKRESAEEHLEQARKAIAKGDMSAAELLYHKVLDISSEQAAEAYYQLGCVAKVRIDYKQADYFYTKAIQFRPENLIYLNSAGEIKRILGQYKEADEIFKRALKKLQESRGEKNQGISGDTKDFKGLSLSQDNFNEAVSFYLTPQAIRRLSLGHEHSEATTIHNNFDISYIAQDNLEFSEMLFGRTLALKTRNKPSEPDSLNEAAIINNLAASYQAQGKYMEAEGLYLRALAIYEKKLRPDHPEVAASLNNLAGLYQAQGKYGEAEPLFRRALAIWEKSLGPEHPDVARSLNNLAALYGDQGKYSDAEPLFRRALAIREKVLGPEHPDVAISLNNLAELYRTQGKYVEAEPFYHRALAIYEKSLGPEHPDVAQSLNNMAALYGSQGKYREAEPLYRRALAILEKSLGQEHPDVATSLNNLAGLYQAQGKYGQAEPLYKRALAILEKSLGPEHPNVATCLENYALLLKQMGRGGEAAALEARARAIRAKRGAAPPIPEMQKLLTSWR